MEKTTQPSWMPSWESKSNITARTVCKEVLPPEICQKTIALWDDQKAEDAMVEQQVSNASHRVGAVQWIRPDLLQKEDEGLLGAIFTKPVNLLRKVNATQYELVIKGLVGGLQLSRYGVGDFYGWHMDIGAGHHRQRKLSFSIQLSPPEDYEGGILEFPYGSPFIKDQGAMIIFPSFMAHRVTEVTEGIRWALVGWVIGPEWM